MAKHTTKALHGSGRQPGSKHSAVAMAAKGSGGRKTARSKHTTVATGASRPPGQLSKGGGTNAASAGYVGKPRRPYQRGNTTGVPFTR